MELLDAQQQLDTAVEKVRASDVARSAAAEEAVAHQHAAASLGSEADALRVRPPLIMHGV